MNQQDKIRLRFLKTLEQTAKYQQKRIMDGETDNTFWSMVFYPLVNYDIQRIVKGKVKP